MVLVLCFLLLRSIDRRDEHTANDSAVMTDRRYGFFRYNAGSLRDLKPILCFIALFERYLKLCNEICFAMRVFRLSALG